MSRPTCAVISVLLTAVFVAHTAHGQRYVAGADFSGGAKDVFGSVHFGELVNIVYAQSTGPLAAMRTEITLDRVPADPLFLHIKGRDDDAPDACRIAITVNGASVFEGPNPSPADQWGVHRFALPDGAAKPGANEIIIANIEPEGPAGMPPWFMAAACGIGPEDYELRDDIGRNFIVRLPDALRPLPEPLPDGAEPGFRIRGTKGWYWTPEQYLAEIPILAQAKMNFLMNCYTSMFTGPGFENRWREPIPDERKTAYERVVRRCEEYGINFLFALHPQLGAADPLDPTSDADFDDLWPHFDWAQSIGVRWFSLPLDDVHIMEGVRISGPEHAHLINKLFARLRERDPEAQFIFCPTWYWGDGSGETERAYLEALADELHPDVYLFWTGDGVTGAITRKGAETYRGFARHRIILWDNYPVNDGHPTMHLGPVTGRDPELCEVVDGYMSNPHRSQNEINRIPLLTCADYAWNPRAYDPERSIGQAIAHLEPTPEARAALRDLVQAYPGMLLYGNGSPAFNAVRDQYLRLATLRHARFTASAYLRSLEELSDRLHALFPDRYVAAQNTLDDDIAWIRAAFIERFGDW